MAKNGIFGISWWENRRNKLQSKLDKINSAWESRSVKDTTAEPEWEEYENTLYALAEVEGVLECLV